MINFFVLKKTKQRNRALYMYLALLSKNLMEPLLPLQLQVFYKYASTSFAYLESKMLVFYFWKKARAKLGCMESILPLILSWV